MDNDTRLYALDVFRGFTIMAMIIVNHPGSWDHVFAPLLHKDWHGITPTDLIYPFFLFIVGVSIYYTYSKKISGDIAKSKVYKKIIVRSLKIFGVGIFLNLYPLFNIEELRVAGVLQRIAIVFLFCSVLFLHTNWKTQFYFCIFLLVGYCMMMTWIPTPGYDKPMLEPGENMAAWLDAKFLPGKMWEGHWDPEGILSTIPAFVTTISGMLVGRFIGDRRMEAEGLLELMIYGFISCVFGVVWHYFFPINKPIWSSSYVLVTSGLATIVLSCCLYYFDIKKYREWTLPTLVFGTNAISAYFLAGILSVFFYDIPISGKSLNHHFVDAISSFGILPKISSLLYALLYVSIIFIPLYFLYKKKIFIKL